MSEPIHAVSNSARTTLDCSPSPKESPSASCNELDVEKAEGFDDDKALASYVVPVLDKGVKTALAKPASRLTRFRVWYNPYRMVSTLSRCWNRDPRD